MNKSVIHIYSLRDSGQDTTLIPVDETLLTGGRSRHQKLNENDDVGNAGRAMIKIIYFQIYSINPIIEFST